MSNFGHKELSTIRCSCQSCATLLDTAHVLLAVVEEVVDEGDELRPVNGLASDRPRGQVDLDRNEGHRAAVHGHERVLMQLPELGR